MSATADVPPSLSPSRDDEEGSFSKSSSCPYAKTLDESRASSSSLPGLVELRQCPAFSKECPFKSATNREEVAEQLKKIPAGHMAKDGPLYKSLKYFHEANKTVSGDCPVRDLVSVPKEWSFHRKVEELSLVSIMAEEIALTIEQEDSSSGEADGNTGTASLTNMDDLSTISPIPSEGKETEKRRSLSDALKSGTASAHKAAESVHFVKNFIRGKIDRELYALMVAQLYHLYGNLEMALNRHAPTHFGSCHFPRELHRRAALQEDTEFWHRNEPEISPATQDYIDRIQYLSENKPLLLLAHAYTRYLGDLSGGKVLARVAKRALNLTGKDDDGLAFYQFPEVESYKLFKDKYRAALDDLSLNEEQIQDLVQEANVAFLLNMRLFEELDVSGGVVGATIRPLAQVYDSQQFMADEEAHSASGSADECPFIARQKKNQLQQHTAKCPWPFTVFHDRQAFFQAWQTWFVIGLLLLSLYSTAISS